VPEKEKSRIDAEIEAGRKILLARLNYLDLGTLVDVGST
jgi:hypothetical protein